MVTLNPKFDLYYELVKTNFKMKYRGSVLGFLWVLMKPFLMFCVLFIAFSGMGRQNNGLSSQQYAVYLLTGLVTFYYINDGILLGMNSLLDRAGVILKVNFDRKIAVLSGMTLGLINLLVNFSIVLLMALVFGVHIQIIPFLYVIGIFLSITLFTFSISLFSSILLIRFRDLSHIVDLGMQLLFYASAVFYPIDIIPEKWRFVIYYNPFAIFIDAIRQALVWGNFEHYKYVILVTCFSLIMLVIGIKVFDKNVKKIAEYF
ncbi:ABC transporter permease [Candidatus Dojkabacteria bacterium]|nr:ABC transporter permease [Candidatus Dojkabacteria bacterium]